MLTHYPEPLVARVVGVKKPRLAAVRRAQLVKGADWIMEHQVVCYLPGGLEKLLAGLGLAGEAFVWPAAAVGGAEAQPEAEARKEALAGAGEALPEQKISEPAAKVAAAVEAAAEARPLVELTVKACCRNPKIVIAFGPEGGPEVLVRVKNNLNYLPGMLVQARAPGPEGGPWCQEGNCPRWRGHY